MKLDKWPEEVEVDGWRWERECHHLGEISKGREFTYFAMDKIQAPVTSQLKFGEWIKCSDRLPEVGVEVLIFGNTCNEPPKILGVKGRYQGDQDWKYTWESEEGYIFREYEVTHWTPLPVEPK